MIYLETGKMSWASTYGTGRYINELVKTNAYDYVICAASQEAYVPMTNRCGVVAFDDDQYRKELSDFMLNLKEGDMVHFPANTIIEMFIPGYVKVIYTLHDLTPLFFYKHKKRNGNYFSDGMALSTKEWKANVLYALKRADCVLTVSENTKNDIVKYFAIPDNKIKVIYHGVDEQFERHSFEKIEEKRALYGLNNKKIIMSIAGAKHKNLVRVILAYYILCVKKHTENYCFVLVGAIIPKIDILTKVLQKKGNFFLTGRVSDEELVWLYNLSDCFIFASLYEGFGFPLLEAYACGTPVVAANNSSLKELNGGYARLVNPRKILQISNAMKENLQRSEELILNQIEYAKSFTWESFRKKHKKEIDELMKM